MRIFKRTAGMAVVAGSLVAGVGLALPATQAGAVTSAVVTCKNIRASEAYNTPSGRGLTKTTKTDVYSTFVTDLAPYQAAIPGTGSSCSPAGVGAGDDASVTSPYNVLGTGVNALGTFAGLSGKIAGGRASCATNSDEWPQSGSVTVKYSGIDAVTLKNYSSAAYVRKSSSTNVHLPEGVVLTGIVTKGIGVGGDFSMDYLTRPDAAKRPALTLATKPAWTWWPVGITPLPVNGINTMVDLDGAGTTFKANQFATPILDGAFQGLNCQSGTTTLFDGATFGDPDGPLGPMTGTPYKQVVTKAYFENSYGVGSWAATGHVPGAGGPVFPNPTCETSACVAGTYTWTNGFPMYPNYGETTLSSPLPRNTTTAPWAATCTSTPAACSDPEIKTAYMQTTADGLLKAFTGDSLAVLDSGIFITMPSALPV